jgi:glucosamine-6-phosphate deaminase
VAKVVEGPITAMVPGSALQLHPHVTVVVDDAAAASLTLADYYRETWAGKPRWQEI